MWGRSFPAPKSSSCGSGSSDVLPLLPFLSFISPPLTFRSLSCPSEIICKYYYLGQHVAAIEGTKIPVISPCLSGGPKSFSLVTRGVHNALCHDPAWYVPPFLFTRRKERISAKALYPSSHLLLPACGGAELMAVTVIGDGAEGNSMHQKPVSLHVPKVMPTLGVLLRT